MIVGLIKWSVNSVEIHRFWGDTPDAGYVQTKLRQHELILEIKVELLPIPV